MAERLPFEFMGTKSVPLSIDPDEFKGMSTPRVTDEIKRMLRSLAPDVSFFSDDIELAADVITGTDVRAK